MAEREQVVAEVSIAPDRAYAGQVGTWTLTCTVTSGLIASGSEVYFVPQQKAAKLWPPSQVDEPWGENYTTVGTDADAELAFLSGKSGYLRGAQKYVLGVVVRCGKIGTGESLAYTFGDTSSGSPGMRMFGTAHSFALRMLLKSAGDDTPHELGAPIFHVTPAEPARLKAIAPSVLRAGRDYVLRVQVNDEYGNPVSEASTVEVAPVPGVSVSDAQWADGVVKTRFRASPDCEPGPFNFHVRAGALTGASNPVRVEPNPDGLKLFWGDLHAHTNLAQGLESPDFVYHWAKQVEGLDFMAHVEHDAAGDIDIWVGEEFRDYREGMTDIREYIDETWELRKRLVRGHYEEGSFVPFLGYEWASNVYGHMNVIYRSDDAPIFYPDSFWQEDFDQHRLWALLSDFEAMTIPHHTSTVPNWAYASGYNWDYYDERFVRNVEIYSKWGCSEYFECPRATVHQTPGTCVIEALDRGYRFGFVGGSDSHASRPGSDFVEFGWDGIYRQSGLTAVYAHELTRDALFDAMARRHCYATTGVRMILEFAVNEHPMGSEVTVGDRADVKDVSFAVHGTDSLEAVEIVKNGAVVYRYQGRDELDRSIALTIPDRTATSQAGDFYYLRVRQADGSMGWASPIWVSTET